jgi:tetratricopeptide (TPR) repeat protein
MSLAAQAASVCPGVKGDWVEARVTIERWIAVLRGGNVLANLPGALGRYAFTLAQLGETAEALQRIREAEHSQHLHTARGRGALGRAYHPLAQACLVLGRLDEARSFAERAIESTRGQPGYAAEVLHLLGDIATHPDRFDAARGEPYYRQALALAEPRGMRPLVAHCHLGLGRLYRQTGDQVKAEEHLTTARAMYREMEMVYYLAQVDAVGAGGDP